MTFKAVDAAVVTADGIDFILSFGVGRPCFFFSIRKIYDSISSVESLFPQSRFTFDRVYCLGTDAVVTFAISAFVIQGECHFYESSILLPVLNTDR